ncbi:hypothetical protein RHGRI_002021 [Rhododendron griersonianum]|uniref:Uncharacterized protein n=1 Tax=Rhododendron griersonianum TaxID=479676 RepID=A0AAV6LPH4_9ERIC|nr:hypothetical protein RHGRI_002021 [Rhododendron griersonianum]
MFTDLLVGGARGGQPPHALVQVCSGAEEGYSREAVKRSHHPTIGAVAGDHFAIRWLLDISETFGVHFSEMVEIDDGERPSQAVGGDGVD